MKTMIGNDDDWNWSREMKETESVCNHQSEITALREAIIRLAKENDELRIKLVKNQKAESYKMEPIYACL
jgi:hypothetical protein